MSKQAAVKLGILFLLMILLLILCRIYRAHGYSLDYFDLGLYFLGAPSGKVVSIFVDSPSEGAGEVKPTEEGEQKYSVDQMGPQRIVPGIGIDDVAFGSTADDVRGKWGEPHEESAWRMHYTESKGISVWLTDGKVRAFKVSGADLRTPEGIGVGSTVSEVRKAYGHTFFDSAVYEDWQNFLFTVTRSLLIGLLIGWAVHVSLKRTTQLQRWKGLTLSSVFGYCGYLLGSIIFTISLCATWRWIGSCLAGISKYPSWIWKGLTGGYFAWLLRLTPMLSFQGALLGFSLDLGDKLRSSKAGAVPWKKMFSMILLGLLTLGVFRLCLGVLYSRGFPVAKTLVGLLSMAISRSRLRWENVFIVTIVGSLLLLRLQGHRMWPTWPKSKMSWREIWLGR